MKERGKEKLYRRRLVGEVEKYLDSKEAVAIYGARQVGKTSLLRYLMENNLSEYAENTFYFDLEIRELLDMCNRGPEGVYSYLLQKGAREGERIYLLIDEVQYMEDPAKFIKIFHDHYPNLKLIVSGSSTFEIKKKFSQSLAGRVMSFELYPLSFEEFLAFRGKKFELRGENMKAVNEELVPLAEEYIRFGGYPRIVLERSGEKKKAYLSQLINSYVRKDIRDIGQIRNISGFNSLLEALASQSGQILNVSELSSTLDMNYRTVLEYLDLLESTFIIKRVRPFHRNLRSELSKNPKVFLTDTGLMHLLWLKEFPQTVLGSSFETFVFLELMKTGMRINFWRTKSRREVDFVLPEKGPYAVEAKYSFKSANMAHLNFFREKYSGEAVVVGLKGEKPGKYGKYIWELVKGLENW